MNRKCNTSCMHNSLHCRARRIIRQALRYRRTAALYAVRGASYSAGATAVSLAVLWARHRY
ncbi:hypothetical protein [Actinacidiphila oryziradicis]|uniref:Uncharacterized protein n=1 Tax=Actinacidiphila oryziradicis TaxID=2571141 RepID=A0A4U0RV32_9ACTN|nr:hypothetical protein [Actinacidiphila oryziradicis]TJZ99346.1 hypothetical protein FCI23_46180 [Actinacidiphila oryziradicis]